MPLKPSRKPEFVARYEYLLYEGGKERLHVRETVIIPRMYCYVCWYKLQHLRCVGLITVG